MTTRRKPATSTPAAAAHLLGGELRLPGLALLFVAVSLADFLMTYRLLAHGRFVEANPVAQWFFARWNVAGMIGFKLGLVAFIIILGETIERYRPRVGAAVLVFGCVASILVTIHGARLLIEHG